MPLDRRGALHGFVHKRDLLRELVVREFKVRYKRSVLGILWALVAPLLQLSVMVVVFGKVLRLDVENYPSFLFSALLAWSWFQSSLMSSAVTITGSRELVRRPGFPTPILPIATVATNLITYLLALPVLLAFVAFDGELSFAIALLPLVVAMQFLVTLSPAYLLAASQVFYRDTWHILSVGLLLMFYVTPIFYELRIVPSGYRWAFELNPLATLISAYRAILMEGRAPDWSALGILCLVALGTLAVGFRVFVRASDRFAEEL